MINIIERIDKLMHERGWNDYKLAAKSGLSSSTLANIHRRKTVPSISTLEAICNGFGITLSQFFSEDMSEGLSDEQKELFDKWVSLTKEQKAIIEALINEFK